MVADITDRKLVEIAAAEQKAVAARALAETVALLETLLKSAPVGFAFVDRDFRFVRINDALAEMNGLPASEHLGRKVSGDRSAAVAAARARSTRRCSARARPCAAWRSPARPPHEPGVQRHWVVSYYPVQVEDGGHVIGVGVVATEVTESVQLESHLRQSQKLEAVGLLAGGVAHDFDNALAAIIITAELAQRKSAVGDIDTHLDSILRVARSANGLTRQLLLFSRQEPVAVRGGGRPLPHRGGPLLPGRRARGAHQAGARPAARSARADGSRPARPGPGQPGDQRPGRDAQRGDPVGGHEGRHPHQPAARALRRPVRRAPGRRTRVRA